MNHSRLPRTLIICCFAAAAVFALAGRALSGLSVKAAGHLVAGAPAHGGWER